MVWLRKTDKCTFEFLEPSGKECHSLWILTFGRKDIDTFTFAIIRQGISTACMSTDCDEPNRLSTCVPICSDKLFVSCGNSDKSIGVSRTKGSDRPKSKDLGFCKLKQKRLWTSESD